MKYLHPLLLVAIILFTSCTVRINRDNQLTKSEIKEGWILLFDGISLPEWRTFQQDSVVGWEVKNGEMIALGNGGDHANDLITKNKFENFELTIEWALSTGGNSGIFYHVAEDTFNAVYQTGPEYQLIDDEGFPDPLEDWQHTAANYAMKSTHSKVSTNPPGLFNTSRIVVNGPDVQHWLNGKLVLEDTLWTNDWETRKSSGKWKDYESYGVFETGHIALQDHGGITRFKNVKIKVLPGEK